MRESMVQMGNDPVVGPPAQFEKFLQDEVTKWGKVIKQANVKIED